MTKSLFARHNTGACEATQDSRDTSHANEQDAEHVYLRGFGALSAQGDGSSPQSPLQIVATTSAQGVPQEYAHLQRRFGTIGEDWTIDVRSLERNAHGRMVETFRLSLKNGTRVDVHFDVSNFYER